MSDIYEQPTSPQTMEELLFVLLIQQAEDHFDELEGSVLTTFANVGVPGHGIALRFRSGAEFHISVTQTSPPDGVTVPDEGSERGESR